jgi:ABC-type amino acid transport system permease subunit
MDWNLVGNSLWPIVKGAVIGTIPVALASFVLGLALGLLVALMRLSRVSAVSGLAREWGLGTDMMIGLGRAAGLLWAPVGISA